MFDTALNLAVNLSSYTNPIVYVPQIILGFTYGYAQGHYSFKKRYGKGGDPDYLMESGLVNTSFPVLLATALGQKLATSGIGLVTYWMGGVINSNYRVSFIVDRLTEMVTPPILNEDIKHTLIPWLYPTFSNYGHPPKNASKNPEGYYAVMSELKDTYNLSFGYDKRFDYETPIKLKEQFHTKKGIVSVAIDRDTQGASIVFKPYTLLEKTKRFFLAIKNYFYPKDSIKIYKDNELSSKINEFYAEHGLHKLTGLHLSAPIPKELRDLKSHLKVVKRSHKDTNEKLSRRIRLENGYLYLNLNKKDNDFTLYFEPYSNRDPATQSKEKTTGKITETEHLAAKLTQYFQIKSPTDPSTKLNMTDSELETVLNQSGFSTKEALKFKKVFKPKENIKEIKDFFNITTQTIKLMDPENPTQDLKRPSTVLQLVIPSTKLTPEEQVRKSEELLKALELLHFDEIRIVNQYENHGLSSKLLQNINADVEKNELSKFKQISIKYFEFNPKEKLDETIFECRDINLSITTMGFNNKNLDQPTESQSSFQRVTKEKPEKHDKAERVKAHHAYGSKLHITHVYIEKPKFSVAKLFNTLKLFLIAELSRDFFIGIAAQPIGAAASLSQYMLNIFIFRPLNFTLALINALIIPLKIIFFGLGALYLKLTGADQTLFEGHELKVLDGKQKRLILSPEPTTTPPTPTSQNSEFTCPNKLSYYAPPILTQRLKDPEITVKSGLHLSASLGSR